MYSLELRLAGVADVVVPEVQTDCAIVVEALSQQRRPFITNVVAVKVHMLQRYIVPQK